MAGDSASGQEELSCSSLFGSSLKENLVLESFVISVHHSSCNGCQAQLEVGSRVHQSAVRAVAPRRTAWEIRKASARTIRTEGAIGSHLYTTTSVDASHLATHGVQS